MSIFAGIVSMKKQRCLHRHEKDALFSLLKYDNKTTRNRWEGVHACCAHVNSHALTNETGYISEHTSIAMLAGQMHLDPTNLSIDTEKVPDVALVHRYWTTLGSRLLLHSHGTFCLAHLDMNNNPATLTLMSDKLGVRPLYYCVTNDLVIFSTAIKILKGLPFVPIRLDLTGVSEMIALGSTLADRTPYLDIKVLRAAEVIQFTQSEIRHYQYWKWDRIATIKSSKKEMLEEASRRFRTAIRVRLQDDHDVACYLSGGMDSRAIVGTLVELDVTPHTFTFSPIGSQDLEFARAFASEIGCSQFIKHRPSMASSDFQLSLLRQLKTIISQSHVEFERPLAVWSGDGGSVGVGAVYLDQQMIEVSRSHASRQAAASRFIASNRFWLPVSFYTRKFKVLLRNIIEDGIVSELERLDCDDPAQALYLFLMLNDQRRHLANVYEHVDNHLMEYHLPFFDGYFLEWIVSIPIDYRLGHLFYTDWFEMFPEAVRAVPWQTYPGHAACTVASSAGFSYQWDDSSRLNRHGKYSRQILGFRRSLSLLKSNSEIWHLMSRAKLAAATMLHLVGLSDYMYVIEAAETYSKYMAQNKSPSTNH